MFVQISKMKVKLWRSVFLSSKARPNRKMGTFRLANTKHSTKICDDHYYKHESLDIYVFLRIYYMLCASSSGTQTWCKRNGNTEMCALLKYSVLSPPSLLLRPVWKYIAGCWWLSPLGHTTRMPSFFVFALASFLANKHTAIEQYSTQSNQQPNIRQKSGDLPTLFLYFSPTQSVVGFTLTVLCVCVVPRTWNKRKCYESLCEGRHPIYDSMALLQFPQVRHLCLGCRLICV